MGVCLRVHGVHGALGRNLVDPRTDGSFGLILDWLQESSFIRLTHDQW
jgi:hypothetical protein